MKERDVFSQLLEGTNVTDLCDNRLLLHIEGLLETTNTPDIMWPNMLEYIQAKIRLRITEREVEAAKQRKYDEMEVEEIREMEKDL